MEIPAEPPECPVCFNLYDAVLNIPRVLSCGHSTCENCLPQLPNPFPNTISCPSCTQPVKLPDRLSSLPKNIDLLRLSYSLRSHSDNPVKVISENPPSVLSELDNGGNVFTPSLWSREFYLNWKNWVLPKDCVLVELNSEKRDGFSNLCYGKIVKTVNNGNSSCGKCVLRENEEVGLVKVGTFRAESEKREETVGSLSKNSCEIKYSYEAMIMKVLFFMKENDRDELGLVLKTSLKLHKVGRICGFWCNEEDNCVFIACEGFRRGLTKSMGELENGFLGKSEDEVEKVSKLGGFGMIGMEMCEVVKDLHVEGLIIGCLGVSCFGMDEFSHVFVDFGEVLAMGRRVWSMVAGNEDQEDKALQKYVFVCPEVLIELLRNEGIELGNGSLRYEVGYGSDVWSLACVLIWLLAGKQFAEEMNGYYNCLFTAVSEQEGRDFMDLYIGWKEKIIAFLGVRLGSELMPLKDILSKCLDFDPGKRPVLIEIWKCIRKLIVTPKFDVFFYPETELMMGISGYCIGLSNLCQSVIKTKKGRFIQVADDLLVKDEIGGKAVHQDEVSGVHGDVVDGVSSAHVKCIGPKAHLDCTTGLAVGASEEKTEAGKPEEASTRAPDRPISPALPPPEGTAIPHENASPAQPLGTLPLLGDLSQLTLSSQEEQEEPLPLNLHKRKHPGRNVTIESKKAKMGRSANTSAGFSLLSGCQVSPIEPSRSYQTIPMAQFNPMWDYQVNDRLNLETCQEFTSGIIPPMEKKAMATLEDSELDPLMSLALTQGLFLATEMSSRYRKNLESVKKLNSDLARAQQGQIEAERRQREAEKLKQGVERDLASSREENRKLKKKNKTLSEKVSTQKARIKELTEEKKALEARCKFYSGEGASLLVKNLLASSQFVYFMADLCNSVMDLGSTSAYQEVKRLHPEIEVDKMEGYDAKSGENLNILMTNLTTGRVHLPVVDFIPSFPTETTPATTGAEEGGVPENKESSGTQAFTLDENTLTGENEDTLSG